MSSVNTTCQNVTQGYDIMEEMYSPKSAASNFLHELCESRQKNLAPFMQQARC